MSSLLFASDLLGQDDPARVASRSQAERRIVDRGRVSTAFTAITPSDDAPRAGSEPAAVVVSRTDQTPNVVVILSNPRVGLDQSSFGRVSGIRVGIDPTRTTTHFASAGATSSHSGSPAAANPASIPATPSADIAPADSGIRPLTLAPTGADGDRAFTIGASGWSGGLFTPNGASGGDSGDGEPDVRVFISGDGWHEGDPGDPPDVIQGMPWSGSLLPAGANAADYTIQKFTWTFPGGALKGYGNFEYRVERPLDPLDQGSYQVFTSGVDDQSTDSAMVVDTFSADDLEHKDSSLEDNDHVLSKFYWPPGVEGVQSVSVSATLKNVNTGDTITRDDTVKYTLHKVDAPQGINVTVFGATNSLTPGVATDNKGNQVFWFGVDGMNEASPGIEWTARLTTNETDHFNGSFAVTQTVTSVFTRSFKNANNQTVTQEAYLTMPGKTRPGIMLDILHARNYDPDTKQPLDPVQSVGATINSLDMPGFPLTRDFEGTPVDYVKTSSYTTTLMFRPWSASILEDSIWTPVGSITWSWKGKAIWINPGEWVELASPNSDSKMDSPYSQTTTFPVWSTSVGTQQQSGWQTVP